MAFTHVGTKYIKRQQDFDNFLKFRHTLVYILESYTTTIGPCLAPFVQVSVARLQRCNVG